MSARAAATLATAALAAACGSHAPPAPATALPAVAVPVRAATPGDGLLGRLPAGADVLIELDLARLRGNDVVGDATRALLGQPAAPGVVEGLPFLAAIGTPALARADAVVLASYRVGTAQAETLTLVAGSGITATDVGGVDVGGGVVAVAPPETLARLDQAPGLDVDDELRAERARAMPEGATGAVVRVTARLDFDAQVALASQLDLDQAPAALSVWGDVADDLAVVAEIDAPDAPNDALAAAIERWRDALADRAPVVLLGLSPAARAIAVTPRDGGVRVVALIGPRRLARATRRLQEGMQVPAEARP